MALNLCTLPLQVATTLLPIIGDFLDPKHPTNPNWACIGIYLPYFLLPLSLAIRMLWPYGVDSSSRAKKRV